MSSSKALFPPVRADARLYGKSGRKERLFLAGAVRSILTNVEDFSVFPWPARRLYAMFGGLNFQR